VLSSVVLSVLLGLCGAASAKVTPMRGTILAIEASDGRAVVRQAATAAMPAMTMTYRIAPARSTTLRVGDRIVASVDDATQPATLRGTRVLSSAPIVTPVSPIRTATIRNVGDKVPQTPLVDQNGAPFTMSKYLGQNVVVAFIYTRCPDPRECPLTTAKFGQLQALLRGRRTHLIEVTLDPVYDRPPILARYARVYSADATRWTFATGDPNDVLNFASAFGLNPLADAEGNLIHGESLAIVDRLGVIRDLIYTSSWRPSEIAAELNDLDHRSSNPLTRLDLWLSQTAIALCGNSVANFDGLSDLLVVLVILGVLGFGLRLLYRAIFGSAV